MALDPRAEVGRGVLVAVLVRLAELMVQVEGRGQRGKRDQREPEDQNQRRYGKACSHLS